MSLQFRGPEGIRSRMEEIRGRMDSIRTREGGSGSSSFVAAAASEADFSQLMASISPSGPGSFAPVDPLHGPIGLGVQPVGGTSGFSRSQMVKMAREAAARNGLDGGLYESLIEQESGFNPKAVSLAGAQGLSQLMPSTSRALGISDPFDPAQSLDGGARYLAQMMKEFGSPSLALAAYNAGPGAVRRHGGIPPFAETQNYVKSILARSGQGG